MADGIPGGGLVPVERAELVTRDMDQVAELMRSLYTEHRAWFRCPDPARAEGRVRSATAGGLNASLIRNGGFAYASDCDPVDPPMAVVCTGGSGIITAGREELRLARGDVFLIPDGRPFRSTMEDGEYATVQVPRAAAGSVAGAVTGMSAADLRFASMAPVSAGRAAMFARTAGLICGQLVTSGAAGISALVVPELTRLAAVAFLGTFPNSTMTAPYLPGPGWVAPAAVRRAAGFIEAHAAQPVTLADIAAAAGVSGRAVQYGFRRYHGITPTGYLRRIRLEYAHADLAAAGPAGGLTVQAVARRWGWASPSQFTVAYQRRFGVPPSRTLRT